jgi:N-acyl-D-aspartate/D-glutamate deacylase
MVRAMGKVGAGILEIAGQPTGADQAAAASYSGGLKALSIETGRPVTFGMFSTRGAPGSWRPWFALVEQAAAEGGRLFVQVHSRALNVLLSFETNTPFDNWDDWREVRALPLAAQKEALRNPETRCRLIASANRPYTGPTVRGTEARPPEWDWLYVMDTVLGPHRSVAEVARERGDDPVATMIDLALEHDLKLFFRQPIFNESEDEVLEMMRHRRSVVTFSDSGAHVSQIMDSSLQTHVLSHWVRQQEAFTLEQAVRLLTYDTATHWGFHDRGLLREGFAADVVVFDPNTVGARMPVVRNDLPAGAKRLVQTAVGICATVVNGKIVLRENEPTGALPGKLLRGPLARH